VAPVVLRWQQMSLNHAGGHRSAFQLSYLGAMANFFAAGAAIACRVLKYEHAAQLIVDRGLEAHEIRRLLASSASKTWKRDVSLIIVAASVARWKAAPDKWSGDIEAVIARELVGSDFMSVSDAAARLGKARWSEIEALAGAEAGREGPQRLTLRPGSRHKTS
jgi:hypothetical protein